MGKAFSEQANLHRVTSSGVALEELLGRQVDALITDYDFAQSQVRNLRVAATVIALRENDFSANYSGVRSEEYDIAVSNPETDCLERLNATIEQLARDGFLKILKREFITGERGPVARRPLPNLQRGTLPLDGRRTGRGPLIGTTAGIFAKNWHLGNTDGKEDVDITDFNNLGTNFSQLRYGAGGAAASEPTASLLLAIGGLYLVVSASARWQNRWL